MIKKSLLILIFLILPINVIGVGFSTTDLFTSDGSSPTDSKTFKNRALTMEISASNIMVSCWDFSNTNCNENPTFDQCFAANSNDFNDCVAYDGWLSGMGYTTDATPETQLMSVSSETNTCVDAIYYKNCDGSGGGSVSSVTNKRYYVFSKRKFDCDEGVPSWYTYDAEGYISGSDYDYRDEISCPTYKKCSESEDGSYVTTYDGVISNPCRTDDGTTSNHACSVNSDCWSNDCGGEISEIKYICGSDGSDDVNEYWQDKSDSCGGQGYVSTSWHYVDDFDCSSEVGSGYVCDSAHDEFVFEDWDPDYLPCRKGMGQTCSAATDCWNDDGGNWCNSISKCTDGANGRGCGSSSDCDSSYCCSNTCSASPCSGGSETDLAILSIIPIQVIPYVDMVKGKSGYVRVIVHNNGPLNATGHVNVTVYGEYLVSTNSTKLILTNQNQTFDFIFKPSQIGINMLNATVSIN